MIDGNVDAGGRLTGRQTRYRATYNHHGQRLTTDISMPDMWVFAP